MAISRKPVDEPSVDTSAEAYEAYLRKGGSAANPEGRRPKNVRFTLEIPGELCQQLDDLRMESPVKTSRHHWVLEAIARRIQQDTQAKVSS
jgi:hypothetical protein